MKLGQNVCLNKIWANFENGSCQVKVRLKTRSLGQMLEKPYVHSRGQISTQILMSIRHICSLILMKLGQNVCLNEIWANFEMGHVRLKSRSLEQMYKNLMFVLEATFPVQYL